MPVENWKPATMSIQKGLRRKAVQALYGNPPPTTFYHWLKCGVVPPPDYYVNVTPILNESTIERDQAQKVAAQAERRARHSRREDAGGDA